MSILIREIVIIRFINKENSMEDRDLRYKIIEDTSEKVLYEVNIRFKNNLHSIQTLEVSDNGSHMKIIVWYWY